MQDCSLLGSVGIDRFANMFTDSCGAVEMYFVTFQRYS